MQHRDLFALLCLSTGEGTAPDPAAARGSSFSGLYGHAIDTDGDFAVIGSRADLHLPPYNEVPELFDLLDPHIGAYVSIDTDEWRGLGRPVYLPSDVTWVELPPAEGFDRSPRGRSVAIDRSGLLIVGDCFAVADAGSSGRAFAFRHNGRTWDLEGELVTSVPGSARFDRVAIEGSVVAATMGDRAAVVLWEQAAGTWGEVAFLDFAAQGVEGIGEIELRDGRLLVGLPNEQRVEVFVRTASGWTLRDVLGGAAPAFGSLVQASERRRAIAGTSSVEVFVRQGGDWSSEFQFCAGTGTVTSLSMAEKRLAVSIDGDSPRTVLFRRAEGAWSDWFQRPEAGMVRIDGQRMLLRDPRSNTELFWPDYDRGTALSFAVGRPGHVAPFGANPPGGLIVLAGTPTLGDRLELLIDDPSQTFSAPALPFLLASAGPAKPGCRVLFPGARGEMLIDPCRLLKVYDSPPSLWRPGFPGAATVDLPSELAWLGRDVYLQGGLRATGKNASQWLVWTEGLHVRLGL